MKTLDHEAAGMIKRGKRKKRKTTYERPYEGAKEMLLAEDVDNLIEITIGCRINESYWHRGIAADTVKLMMNYLYNDMGMQKLKAYVMPENVFSEKVLIKYGFIKVSDTAQEKNWGGKEIVDLNVFTLS